jgi:ribosomal-protein-alanine N-acetyltransferase
MPSSSGANDSAPPDEVRLLPMTEDDVDQVLSIERRSFVSPWRREHFLHELRENPWAINRVLKAGDRVIGYAAVWRIAEELKINNLCVEPEMRRRGLARRLLRELLAFARRQGCELATLEVRPSNTAALRLYRSFGFDETGRRPNYYAAEGEDAILMTLRLDAPAVRKR